MNRSNIEVSLYPSECALFIYVITHTTIFRRYTHFSLVGHIRVCACVHVCARVSVCESVWVYAVHVYVYDPIPDSFVEA